MKRAIWVIGGLILIGALIGSHKGSNNNSTSDSSSNAGGSSLVTHGSFRLIVSQSSCQEDPGLAYVNCSIGVGNIGAEAGLPTVYVLYRYSDSGESYDTSHDAIDRGGVPSDPIPPGEVGYVYFSHPYKATTHDLIQAAASLDENADKMPYIRVADPFDPSWPN